MERSREGFHRYVQCVLKQSAQFGCPTPAQRYLVPAERRKTRNFPRKAVFSPKSFVYGRVFEISKSDHGKKISDCSFSYGYVKTSNQRKISVVRWVNQFATPCLYMC